MHAGCLTFKMAQAGWRVTRSVNRPSGKSVERTGTTEVGEEKTLSRTAIAMVRCLESHHTEGACLFDGTPKGDGRKNKSCRKQISKLLSSCA